MLMKIKDLSKRTIISLVVAVLITLVAWSGWLQSADGSVSDALYQRPTFTDGQTTVVGIDQRAIDALGPMPWPRSVMAEVIERLNADPDKRPAVIALDVLYVGSSASWEADEYLSKAAEEGKNVVVASAATFGSSLVERDGSFYLDTRSVLAWDSPYTDLYNVTDTGHINAMSDSDGVLRHALLYIDGPSGERVYSFSRVIYERWCEETGTEPNPLPETYDDGFFYIPFTAKSGSYYEDISVIDILNGSVSGKDLSGKIVLIGPYAAGMQDEYRTSIDRAVPMYGIEIQANLIDAFKKGFYPKEADDTLQLAILFALVGAMFFFLWNAKVKTSVIVWLICAGGFIVLSALLYKAGVVLHVMWVPMSATAVFIASVALNYMRAQKEKRRVSDTFGRYVDPAIIQQLLDRGGEELELGGKMYNIAVLFVDIRGFTTMSESLDPPTVVEIINRYLTLTTECIMRYHGTLDKFVGDCTMAFWNAPLKQEDPVFLACCAAMDMVEGSKALGDELLERFGRTVSFGVGVNYGPAVVGNIGAPKRMDYTAIGDTVNTASRLESNAPGGKIFISRVVADALGDRARVTSLGGSIKLKGKAEGFEVLTLDELDY
ncbi:MAG: CHASE2 domain-containing protein [Clostridia bacterium]|nr:CHASE2 domain-containing protein [Clostridia bacterium]